jgi:hypothetical protein
MSDKDFSAVFGIVIAAAVIALATYAFVFAIPLALAIGAGYAIHWSKNKSPAAQERKAREHTQQLYQSAKALTPNARDPDAFAHEVLSRLPATHEAIRLALGTTAASLYEKEYPAGALPPPPPVCNSIEGARYRDFLSAYAAKARETIPLHVVRDVLVESFTDFIGLLPSLPPDGRSPFSVPLVDLVDDEKLLVQALMVPFVIGDARQYGLFADLYKQLTQNYEATDEKNPIYLVDYTGENPAQVYLANTELLDIFYTPVPFVINQTTRYEHHWIVAPPGTGKSTVLQTLLLEDFELVADGRASVIVIDSNRDLVKSIEGLALFSSGGLAGRLISIDAEDVEWPIALNIFDVDEDHPNLSPRDREILYNSATSMLDYVFRALLGAEMTSRQSTLFNFTIQLLLQIPDATLDTLIDLMRLKAMLDRDGQDFFRLKFDTDELRATKSQVVDRLFAIKRIRALSRMFSSPKTKLNLFDAMSGGNVILINAPKSLLQEDGVEIFTRFFLANILLAAEKRQLLPQAARLPTFLYIDE